MYLYIIIGAILVLYKEVFALLTHIIPFLYKGVIFIFKLVFTNSAKGAWYMVKKSHQVTYQKFHDVDRYMMNRRWQK